MTTHAPPARGTAAARPRSRRRHEELHVWQEAVELAIACYQCSAHFPLLERFGLTARLRRAAVTVVSSIVDGHRRRRRGAVRLHLALASRALDQLDQQLAVAARLGYGEPSLVERVRARGEAVRRLLQVAHDAAHGEVHDVAFH